MQAWTIEHLDARVRYGKWTKHDCDRPSGSLNQLQNLLHAGDCLTSDLPQNHPRKIDTSSSALSFGHSASYDLRDYHNVAMAILVKDRLELHF
jgi:hypothetical protein